MKAGKAIIVGATSGIGFQVTQELSRRGWEIGIAGRREETLLKMQSDDPHITAAATIDVTRPEATEQLLGLIDRMGGMDLYFHSSGIGFQNPSLDMEREVNTVQTNAVGVTRMLCTAFRYLRSHPERPGHIAVISSIAGTRGLGAAPAYSASKRFVNTYMESLTQLCTILRLRHIHLHDVRPGFVRTALLQSGGHYPMQMDATRVAQEIVRGIEGGKSVITVDWRYRVLVALWRLVPRWLWVRLPISSLKE